MSLLKEIKITEIGDFKIGNVEDKENGTGVTVIISKDGMKAGVDIRGGGPASRETPLLNPLMNPEKINALVFSGGSAFGLDASSGVVKYLEEKNIGYFTKFANVPLVCQSCIYDLGYKSSKVRPDAKMGYDACVDSEKIFQEKEMSELDAGPQWENYTVWNKHRNQAWGFMLFKSKT